MNAPSLQAVSRRALDTRHGLFRGLGETPCSRRGGPLFIMGGELVDPRPLVNPQARRRDVGLQVAGAGLTREEALWSALGEGVERYSAQLATAECVARFDASGRAAIDPRDFLFYADVQYESADFPYSRFAPDAAHSWIGAKDLRTGKPRLALLQLAGLGAELGAGEPLLCQQISTGIASHTSRETALLTGLLEVIERDAFMATWLLRRAPPQIKIEQGLLEAVDPRIARLLRHCTLTPRLYLLTTDNAVPVVLCVLRRETPAAIAVGAAARPYLRDAIGKAVVEAFHTWAWGLALEQASAVASYDIADFDQHVRFYFEPAHLDALQFLDRGDSLLISDCADPASATLAGLVGRLNELGHEAYSVDLTSADIAGFGFVVMRALVSGMQPLACGIRNYPLHRRRLKKLATTWGMSMPRMLNLDPHPFP